MTAGSLYQLSAVGPENVFLTVNPQVTFFKTVYRRYVHFTIYQQRLNFNSKLHYGMEAVCKIPRVGDLLNKLYLVINIPQVDIKTKKITNNEVKKMLNEYGIIWPYSDQGQPETTELLTTITAKITELETEIATLTTLYDNITNISQAQTVDEFIMDYVYLVIPDEYETFIDYINTLVGNEYDTYTSPYVHNLLYNSIRSYSNNLADPDNISVIQPDEFSFIDENYILTSNIEYSYYNLRDNKTGMNLFQDNLERLYGNEIGVTYDYKTLDVYKTLLNYLNYYDNNIVNDDLLLESKIYNLLNYISLNFKLNLEILYNIINILKVNKYDFIIFKKYKSQQGVRSNDIKARFINVSLVNAEQYKYMDNFTNYILLKSQLADSYDPKLEEDNMNHFHRIYIKEQLDTFHQDMSNVFNNEKYLEYYENNITSFDANTINELHESYDKTILWNRLAISIYNTFTDDNLTSNLSNLYLMNYIPYLVLDDLQTEITKYLPVMFDISDTIIQTFIDEMNVLNTTLRTNIEPSIIFDTNHNYLQNIDPNTDVNNMNTISLSYKQAKKDIILLGIIRPEKNYGSEIQNYDGVSMITPLLYIKEAYNTMVNTIMNPTGYANKQTIIDTLLTVINSFFLSHDDLPLREKYIKQNYRTYDPTVLEFQVNTTNIVSDAISSIWMNIQLNCMNMFNSLLNDKILNFNRYENTYGIEIYNTYKYLVDNFIDANYKSTVDDYTYVDYYRLNSDIIYSGNIVIDIPDKAYLVDKNNAYILYNKNYDLTKKLLKLKYIQLNNPAYFFNTLDSIIDFYYDIITDNPVYGYGNNYDTELTSILTNVRANINIECTYDVINNLITGFVTANPTLNGVTDTLFAIMNPNYLYKDINNISSNYALFNKNTQIYRYIIDFIIKYFKLNTIIDALDRTSVETVRQGLMDYYQNKINELTTIMNTIGPTVDSPQLYTSIVEKLTIKNINFSWIEYLGYFMIDYVKIMADGQELCNHTGEMLYIINNLTTNYGHQRGINIMTGNMSTLTTYSTSVKNSYRIYVPLQFWFCKYFDSSLPLISLHNSHIYIAVKIKKLDEIHFSDTYINRLPLNGYIIGDFIYVTEKQRKIIAETKHEYIMENVHSDTFIFNNAHFINGNTIEIPIRTNVVCKEIIWTIKTKTNIGNKKYNVFTYNDINPCTHAYMKFNGTNRENIKDIGYYNYIVPYERHTNSSDEGINVYSFSLYPEINQPSGQANFNYIDDIKLFLVLHDDVVTAMNSGELIFVNLYLGCSNIFRVMSGLCGLGYYS